MGKSRSIAGRPGVDRPIRVASVFSGIGGADRGVYAASRLTGIPAVVVDAVDSWPGAVAQYNRNMPHAVATVGDVKTLGPEDLAPHDLLIGGPPCQPFSKAGKKLGAGDIRDCVPDFMRLARDGETPFIMENVVSGLLTRLGVAAYSARLRAEEFGDPTARTRWFYSNIGPFADIHAPVLFRGEADLIVKAAAPRRTFRDIRDIQADFDHLARVRARIAAGTLNADSRWDLPLDDEFDEGMLFEVNADAVPTSRFVRPEDRVTDGNGGIRADAIDNILIAMRGFERGIRIIGPDDVLDGLTGNVPTALSWAHLGAAARCPSLLEMQRAHGFPDDMDWADVPAAADRGKMVANSWPVGMATAVMAAALVALRTRALLVAA